MWQLTWFSSPLGPLAWVLLGLSRVWQKLTFPESCCIQHLLPAVRNHSLLEPFQEPGSLTSLDTQGFPRMVWAISFLPLSPHPTEPQSWSLVRLHAHSRLCLVSIHREQLPLHSAQHPALSCSLTFSPSLLWGPLLPVFTIASHLTESFLPLSTFRLLKREASRSSSLPLSMSVPQFTSSPNLPSPPHWNFILGWLVCVYLCLVFFVLGRASV